MCTIAPTIVEASATAIGGQLDVNITTKDTYRWTIQSNVDWLIPSVTSGIGSAKVSYTIAKNIGDARIGTMIVAGQVLTVKQSTGLILITPMSVITSATAMGGKLYVDIVTPAIYNWTFKSNATWLIPTVHSGIGNAKVGYEIAPNYWDTRTGTMTVATKRVTITQAGVPTM
jgi:hypothetical protein